MAEGNDALERLAARGLAVASSTAASRWQPCSCGCAEPHEIMTRETFDGIKVSIWSDGSVTTGGGLGFYLRGLGVGRSNWARRARALAVRLIADDVSLFTAAELPAVVKVAEKTFAHEYRSDVDRRIHALALARQKLATRGERG